MRYSYTSIYFFAVGTAIETPAAFAEAVDALALLLVLAFAKGDVIVAGILPLPANAAGDPDDKIDDDIDVARAAAEDGGGED